MIEEPRVGQIVVVLQHVFGPGHNGEAVGQHFVLERYEADTACQRDGVGIESPLNRRRHQMCPHANAIPLIKVQGGGNVVIVAVTIEFVMDIRIEVELMCPFWMGKSSNIKEYDFAFFIAFLHENLHF